VVERSVVVRKESGSRPLPFRIDWREVKDPQDAGQYVDGKWMLTSNGLRTAQTGYDRVFLLGERTWQDYEVRTSITIHRIPDTASPISGPNGVGIILRFAGHATGGPRHFSSGQPQWGYQPFGSIGWLRWSKNRQGQSPMTQFYPGDSDHAINMAHFEVREGAAPTISATVVKRWRMILRNLA
jgi:large repetitive protein